MSMQNKVVIITGATSGIGRGCAEVFGREGAKIVFTGRDEKKMEEVNASLSCLGIEHTGYLMDVSNERENRRLVENIIQRYGRIDVVINNAGISMRALLEDLDMAVFRKIMEINFFGTVYLTKYALPYILESKGTIVGVSSINGHRGTPARTAYTASKYAMEGFFEALRTEVMKRGVHVLVVSPGFTGTNIRNAALNAKGESQGESPRDENKMMTPEEVAKRILKGIRGRKRDIVLTTQGKLVVFLNKWIPGLMDKIVYYHMAKEKDSPFK
ncbi:MAG: SDR family oxidoreductase [Cyclobacteriaceae bacterium]|nr:SDR family oxidoreductase [Cyclobacteriaceae bacterium]